MDFGIGAAPQESLLLRKIGIVTIRAASFIN
jgi:hypothetical protein